uniref:Uncharacterized protein n=1 Tax=Arundo donax TaxID=35708 RepID=A0A0A8ZSU3_ARUDO
MVILNYTKEYISTILYSLCSHIDVVRECVVKL